MARVLTSNLWAWSLRCTRGEGFIIKFGTLHDCWNPQNLESVLIWKCSQKQLNRSVWRKCLSQFPKPKAQLKTMAIPPQNEKRFPSIFCALHFLYSEWERGILNELPNIFVTLKSIWIGCSNEVDYQLFGTCCSNQKFINNFDMKNIDHEF